MTLKVIGAGFGRTGTLSTCTALNQLGFPCYHMFEVLENKATQQPFTRRISTQAAPRGSDEGPRGVRVHPQHQAARFGEVLQDGEAGWPRRPKTL